MPKLKFEFIVKSTFNCSFEQKTLLFKFFVMIPFGLAIMKKLSLLSIKIPETVRILTLQKVETGDEIVQS